MSKADLARRTADLGADHDVTRPCPLCGDDGRLVGVSVTGNGVYFCEGDRSPYRTGGPTGCDLSLIHI